MKKETIYNHQPWQTYKVTMLMRVEYVVSEAKDKGAAGLEAGKKAANWERPDDITSIWPEDVLVVRDKVYGVPV